MSSIAAAHRLRVMRLYRNSLRNALNWCIDRTLFYEQARELRGRFQANMNVASMREATDLVAAGEKELADNLHPDPYIPPWRPGGSKYQRNMVAPPEIIDPHLWEHRFGHGH
eukprot:TRINITY_DN310_c0_g2_i1.p2 TRINITY_DN310_c0_g2~~TRINITY_DN310_c0_g2_i1.p2  ORF type:complete len:112 (-),score=9.98 TRINITY_DN310_c0_g2_i1:145-480(-)